MHHTNTKNNTESCIMFDNMLISLKPKHIKSLRLSISKDKKFDSKDSQISQPLITLTHHPKIPHQEIFSFLHTHKNWIIATLASLQSQTQKTQGILASHPNQTMLFGQWQPKISTQNLKTILLAYLHQRVDILATNMNLTYSKISVRTALSRFGSCTQDRLSFSLLLVFAPKEAIDYVIIHELAHIVHKNHSRYFWALVERYCANWKYLRKTLKQNYMLYKELLLDSSRL